MCWEFDYGSLNCLILIGLRLGFKLLLRACGRGSMLLSW